MTPLLIVFPDVKPAMTAGTDLLLAAFGRLGRTVKLVHQRLVPGRVVGPRFAGSLLVAVITLGVSHQPGPTRSRVQSLMPSTPGLASLLTAVAMLYKAARARCALYGWPALASS